MPQYTPPGGRGKMPLGCGLLIAATVIGTIIAGILLVGPLFWTK